MTFSTYFRSLEGIRSITLWLLLVCIVSRVDISLVYHIRKQYSTNLGNNTDSAKRRRWKPDETLNLNLRKIEFDISLLNCYDKKEQRGGFSWSD